MPEAAPPHPIDARRPGGRSVVMSSALAHRRSRSAVTTTPATTVAVAAALAGAATTGRTTRAEVAQVAGQLGVERLVERDGGNATVSAVAVRAARGPLRSAVAAARAAPATRAATAARAAA